MTELSPDVEAWERFRAFATAKGWAVELTPRGRTCCTKGGSVVFGPGHGSDYRELTARIGYIDGLMAAYRERRS